MAFRQGALFLATLVALVHLKIYKFSPSIVGGRDALEKEFPWMAALYYQGRFVCSSFLVTPKVLMTAAHCVVFKDGVQPAAAFYGIVGNINRKGPETRIQFREVVAHPQYNANQGLENDIAFLRMSSPVEMNKLIQPICLLQDDRSFNIVTVQAMGWGSTYNGRHDVAEYLKTTELSILPRPICNQIFVKYSGIKITDNNICVNSLKPTGICYGDSGSPAVYEDPDNDKPVAIGLASFISYFGCGFPQAPSAYTRIASYISWIKRAVGDYENVCFV